MKGIIGKVVSTKMTQTATVLVERYFRVPLYGKIISRKGKIHARNLIGAKNGQTVSIQPCRPYAKTVAFKITEIINPTLVADSSLLSVSFDSVKGKRVTGKTKTKKITKEKV